MRKIIKFFYYYCLYRMFFIFPIKESRIIFESYHGKSFSCNPKYIYEELKKNNKNEFEAIWVLNKKNKTFGSKTVKYRSIRYLFYLATSGYWILNNQLNHYLKPRSKTIYLQTWHGTPLKKIALDSNLSHKQKEYWIKESKHWNYFLSPNTTYNKIFKNAFKIEKDIILNLGYPRNDVLFSKNNIHKIIKKIGIKAEKKIILYAPTFRKSDDSIGFNLNIKKVYEGLGKEYIILLRLHPNIKIKENTLIRNNKIIDISNYNDVQEILKISDYLITDYSSLMFDYSLLKKPIILFTKDSEKYVNHDRGFYFNINDLPFFQTKNEDLLIEYIKKETNHKEYGSLFYEKFTSNIKKSSNLIIKRIFKQNEHSK